MSEAREGRRCGAGLVGPLQGLASWRHSSTPAGLGYSREVRPLVIALLVVAFLSAYDMLTMLVIVMGFGLQPLLWRLLEAAEAPVTADRAA